MWDDVKMFVYWDKPWPEDMAMDKTTDALRLWLRFKTHGI